jgi:hypothetical protein
MRHIKYAFSDDIREGGSKKLCGCLSSPAFGHEKPELGASGDELDEISVTRIWS